MNLSNMKHNDSLIILRELNISLLKTKINSIFPVGGAIINEFLFDLYGRIKQERVYKFVDELAERFQKIEDSAISAEYMQTEDFLDLIYKAFESASKSKADFKRRFLANLLADAVESRSSSSEQNILFASFIESMTANHVNILRYIRDRGPELIEIGSYERYFDSFTKYFPTSQIDKFEFKYYNSELETKSLISTGGGLENFDDQSSRMAFQDHRDASVILTSLGDKFIRYITE